MSKLPRTWEYEHTSWSEDDPLCAQLKRRADAMHDELLARIAEMEGAKAAMRGTITSQTDIIGLAITSEKHLRGRAKQAEATLAERERTIEALEEFIEELDPHHLKRNRMGLRAHAEEGVGT